MSDDDLREAIEIILGSSVLTVRASVYEDIPLEDAESILLGIRDPDALAASLLGAEKQQFVVWKEHDFLCRASTKRGRRCMGSVVGAEERFSSAFDPDLPRYRYCSNHIRTQQSDPLPNQMTAQDEHRDAIPRRIAPQFQPLPVSPLSWPAPALPWMPLPTMPYRRADVPNGFRILNGRLVSWIGKHGRPRMGLLVRCGRCRRRHIARWKPTWPLTADSVSLQTIRCPKKWVSAWVGLEPKAMWASYHVYINAHAAFQWWQLARCAKYLFDLPGGHDPREASRFSL